MCSPFRNNIHIFVMPESHHDYCCPSVVSPVIVETGFCSFASCLTSKKTTRTKKAKRSRLPSPRHTSLASTHSALPAKARHIAHLCALVAPADISDCGCLFCFVLGVQNTIENFFRSCCWFFVFGERPLPSISAVGGVDWSWPVDPLCGYRLPVNKDNNKQQYPPWEPPATAPTEDPRPTAGANRRRRRRRQ